MSGDGKQQIPDLQRLAALRAIQQREAARGCLLALVLEGGALLAALLWLATLALDTPRLRIAAAGAFLVFTLAAAVVGLLVVVQGNLPGSRRLRRDHEEATRRQQAADRVVESDPVR
jgi:hypothetical protein